MNGSGYTLPEVARITGRSLRTVRRWIAEGQLAKKDRALHEPSNAPTRIDEVELAQFLARSQRLVSLPETPQALIVQRQTQAYIDQQIAEQLRLQVLPLIAELRQGIAQIQAELSRQPKAEKQLAMTGSRSS